MGCPFPPFLILWLTELCWRSQCIWAPSLPASWLSNLLFTSGASGWCRCRPGSALYSPATRGGESGGLLCLLSQLESWRSPLPPSLMSHIPRSSPPILPKQHITYTCRAIVLLTLSLSLMTHGGQVGYPETDGWGCWSGPTHLFPVVCPSI